MKDEVSGKRGIVILGIGNTLLQDDGVGVAVTESLRQETGSLEDVRYIDGGTLGLSLLPDIEDAESLIVVDAAELGAPPGTIAVFRNEQMDRQLSGRKSTVHELALSDLLDAAAMSGCQPSRRILVAIQPACTEWGLEPTPEVRKSIPQACSLVRQMTRELRS
jgi:hydrogenase maturation protease